VQDPKKLIGTVTYDIDPMEMREKARRRVRRS
jgi:hypothetical protein